MWRSRLQPPWPDDGFLPFGPPSLLWTPGTGAGWLTQKPPYNPPGPSGDGWINLSGGIDVDELVIDTWCVPEPSALALLIIGGLLAVRRRI